MTDPDFALREPLVVFLQEAVRAPRNALRGRILAFAFLCLLVGASGVGTLRGRSMLYSMGFPGHRKQVPPRTERVQAFLEVEPAAGPQAREAGLWPAGQEKPIFKLQARHAASSEKPQGKPVVFQVARNATVTELRGMLSGLLGIPAPRLQIALGYPPPGRPIPSADFGKTIAQVGVLHLDTIFTTEIQMKEQDPVLEKSDAASRQGEERGTAIANAEDVVEATIQKSAPAGNYKRRVAECEELELPLVPPSEDIGSAQRHKVPADNACLFNTVAYLLKGKDAEVPMAPQVIREVVADQLKSEPERWDPVTLAESGKTSLEYAKKIRKPGTAGGSLELVLLSECYGVQISAISIQSTRVDHYPHDFTTRQRVYVFHDGVHYDGMTANTLSSGEEVRVFDPMDEQTLNKAVGLALDMQQSGEFANKSLNYAMYCMTCQEVFQDGEARSLHKRQTGHFHFDEVPRS